MLTHVDLFIFYRMLGTVSTHTAEIDRINTILGKMETDITVSAFRNALPFYAVPKFAESGMAVEDAILKLKENPTHNFYTFLNVDTNKVNVLFKLKDNKNYGLVEPEA
mgnify:CR=1 FL=1